MISSHFCMQFLVLFWEIISNSMLFVSCLFIAYDDALSLFSLGSFFCVVAFGYLGFVSKKILGIIGNFFF